MKTSKKVEQLRTLFKYVSDSTRVVDGIFLSQKIRFTQPAALNDPLEFNPAIRFDSDDDNFKPFEYRKITFPSIHDWHQLNLVEQRINRYGILSLTDNPYSFEMWSHYANGHKGFLLEFDISDKTRPTLQLQEGLSLRAHKVRYVKDYVINIDKLSAGSESIPFYKIRNTIFLRKTRHWKYEREYRIVRQLDDCDNYKPPTRRTSYRDKNIYLFPFTFDCISSVVFGVNTSQAVKKKVIDSCKDTRVGFFQTIIYKDQQNKIEFISIDTFGPIDKYLEMKPQLFTFDTIKLKNRNPLTVNALHEIPYYHLQQNDWNHYYKKQQARRGIKSSEREK